MQSEGNDSHIGILVCDYKLLKKNLFVCEHNLGKVKLIEILSDPSTVWMHSPLTTGQESSWVHRWTWSLHGNILSLEFTLRVWSQSQTPHFKATWMSTFKLVSVFGLPTCPLYCRGEFDLSLEVPRIRCPRNPQPFEWNNGICNSAGVKPKSWPPRIYLYLLSPIKSHNSVPHVSAIWIT